VTTFRPIDRGGRRPTVPLRRRTGCRSSTAAGGARPSKPELSDQVSLTSSCRRTGLRRAGWDFCAPRGCPVPPVRSYRAPAATADQGSQSMSDRVSERRRAAQVARHYRDQEHLTIAEIARRLGRTEATIKATCTTPPSTRYARPPAPRPSPARILSGRGWQRGLLQARWAARRI
jgi:DNA-binding CsgD family transcriptional regulator